ncbi:hypothetical protein ACRRTK_009966 [Alexandromys fortis]
MGDPDLLEEEEEEEGDGATHAPVPSHPMVLCVRDHSDLRAWFLIGGDAEEPGPTLRSYTVAGSKIMTFNLLDNSGCSMSTWKQHIMLLFKFLLVWMIPDVPKDVAEKIK